MSKAERAAALAALLLVVGCAGAYPVPPPAAPPPDLGLRRFDRVDADVMRSSQPDAAQLQQLARSYGLKSVLKLNHGGDDAPDGVRVMQHTLNPLREPSRAELERILDDIERAPKPLLIHCTHGEDRTGLIVALYRIKHGVPVAEAYTDMVRHGFHPYDGLWAAWVHWVGWDQPPPVAGATTTAPPPPGSR